MSSANTDNMIDTPQEVFSLLPAKMRKAIYIIVVMVGVVSAVYLSVLGFLDVAAPSWYGAATAGWTTLTTLFGLVAASNTSKQIVDTTATSISETVESNPATAAAVISPDVPVVEDTPTVADAIDSSEGVDTVTDDDITRLAESIPETSTTTAA